MPDPTLSPPEDSLMSMVWRSWWGAQSFEARRAKFLSLVNGDSHPNAAMTRRLKTLVELGLRSPGDRIASAATNEWQSKIDTALFEAIATIYHETSISKHNFAVIRLLLQAGANPNCVHTDRRSPLSMAVISGQMPVFDLLLAFGADPLRVDAGGGGLMHDLARSTSPSAPFCSLPADLIHRLLALGLDVNQEDNQGRPPLPVAMAYGNGRWVIQLLDGGADPLLPDRSLASHPTSLHLMVSRHPMHEHEQIMERIPTGSWSCRDANWKTPYDIVVDGLQAGTPVDIDGGYPGLRWLSIMEAMVLEAATPAGESGHRPLQRMRL